MLERAEKKLLLEMVNRESKDTMFDQEETGQARGFSTGELLEDIKFGCEAIFGNSGQTPAMIEFGMFFVKMFAVYFVFIWIRATFPRVRIDQMLNFTWKFLVPLTLVLILVTALVDGLFIGGDQTAVWHFWRIVAHLGFNLLIAIQPFDHPQ